MREQEFMKREQEFMQNVHVTYLGRFADGVSWATGTRSSSLYFLYVPEAFLKHFWWTKINSEGHSSRTLKDTIEGGSHVTLTGHEGHSSRTLKETHTIFSVFISHMLLYVSTEGSGLSCRVTVS